MTDAPIVADLNDDLPLDTAKLEMVKPGTATPNGWVLTMAGPSHPKTIAFKNAKQRDSIHRAATIEAAQINGRKFKPEEKSPDESEVDTMRWVVSRIVTWTPVKVGTETIEFSDEAAIALLRKPTMASYLQQIIDYISAERAFMPTSATT